MPKNTELEKLVAYNQKVKREIDRRLKTFYTAKVKAAVEFGPNYSTLLNQIERVVLLGGKRLRPTLVSLGYEAAGGKEITLCYDAALALEIFHSFVLMHDDVMDGDTRRHGGHNLTGAYYKKFAKLLPAKDALKLAETMSIMGGELNEAFTFEILANLKTSSKLIFELMQHVQVMLFKTAAGQQLDVLSPVRKTINLRTIEKINHYKTACYSIISPLQFGVTLAGGNTDLAAGFYKFGIPLGVAFQLRDDWLGMFGSARQTGKPVGSDLREGKQTMLMYWGKQLCDQAAWRHVERAQGKPDLGAEEIKQVQQILRDCGAEAKTTVISNQYLQTALTELDKFDLDTKVKQQLSAFASYCVDRKK